MNYKTTTILSALATIAAATLCAAPSSNTVEAVTQDWRQGNYSNVYELAQARFAGQIQLDLVRERVLPVAYRYATGAASHLGSDDPA